MNEIIQEIVDFFKGNEQVSSIILGGSRSKGNATNKSDYDFFLLIDVGDFFEFIDGFSAYLEQCKLIDIAAYYGYVENWGYIFKTIGSYYKEDVLFDITILPLGRVDEMALRSTNNVLFDKNDTAQIAIERNQYKCFETFALEPQRRVDYVKLFGLELLRLEKSLVDSDIWLAIKSIERMKQYYMHYKRILENKYSRNQHCPEKQFSKDFSEDILGTIYEVKADVELLCKAKDNLCEAFYNIIDEKEVFRRFMVSDE